MDNSMSEDKDDEKAGMLHDIIDYQKALLKPNLRAMLRIALNTPTVTFLVELFNFIITLILLVQRIIFTYYNENPIDHWIWQIIIHIVLLLEYLMYLYADKYTLKFLLSFHTILSIGTTLPYLIVFTIYRDETALLVIIFHHFDLLRLLFSDNIFTSIESELPRE